MKIVWRSRRGWLGARGLRVGGLALVVGVVLAACGPTPPGPGDYQGPSYEGSTGSPSGSKPQSKVWFHDGTWWAVMFDSVSKDFHLWKLDKISQAWQNTAVKADDRANSRFDLLFDGTKLYVASHVFRDSVPTSSTQGSAGSPSELYRYSYTGGTWALDAGFPAVINNYATETLVLAKDSTGQLWATWTQDLQVYVNRTVGDDAVWGTPTALPAVGSTVNVDDISSIIAFGGDKIGVFWTNQNEDRDYFSVHADAEPTDAVWTPSEVAYTGPGFADDHINLQADAGGKVYAVTKTDDDAIPLLVRDPAAGLWSSSTVASSSENWTRPILILNQQAQQIYAFATVGQAGGDIVRKSSPMSSISFGASSVAIKDESSPDMNNATATKQSVSSATGLVVLATNDTTRFYWHYWDPLT